MTLHLTTDQEQLRETARKFAQTEMASVALELERSNQPPSKAIKKRFAEMGFLGINISPEYGGLGLSNLDAVVVLEEFAKVHPAIAFPIFESAVGPIKAIERFGTDTLKRALLPRVTAGEIVVAVAMSEPDAGTALTDLTTSAVITGKQIIVNGAKRWTTGGGTAEG
jgi:acyl-CoA dehydrogenase